MTLDQIKQEAERLFPARDYRITLPDAVDFARHCVDKATGWRPIADAPKDGSRMLIYLPNSRRKVQEVYWAIPYEGSTAGWWSTPHGPDGRGYTILPESPTHWQPLPPAPEAA